jgi:hypothetical protein
MNGNNAEHSSIATQVTANSQHIRAVVALKENLVTIQYQKAVVIT